MPQPGAYRDQPAGELRRMAVLMDVYDAIRASLRAMASDDDDAVAKWRKRRPGQGRMVDWALEMRGLADG